MRDYGEPSQLGLESTPEEYVAKIVEIFAEVRRVLRDDGTLWLNLGDSYAGSGKGQMSDGQHSPEHGTKQGTSAGTLVGGLPTDYAGLKPKDLCGIPWRVAFALQADGWYLRSDIIWSKPNPMPESVTDRPTKAHEYLFLFAKSGTNQYWTHCDKNGTRVQPEPDYRWTDEISKEETNIKPNGWTIKNKMGWSRLNLWQGCDYYYDTDAIREAPTGRTDPIKSFGRYSKQGGEYELDASVGRNRRTVWEIATQPYPEAHFATFPEKLVEPCILAGSNDRACGVCGAAWERIIKPSDEYAKYLGKAMHDHENDLTEGSSQKHPHVDSEYVTLGFRPTCEHDNGDSRSIVLDPFMGSGTVALVALKFGRDYLGIELKPDYIAMAMKRLKPLGNRPCPQQEVLI